MHNKKLHDEGNLSGDVLDFFRLVRNPLQEMTDVKNFYIPHSFVFYERKIFESASRDIPFIFIEGPLGVGKTTFLKYLISQIENSNEYSYLPDLNLALNRYVKSGRVIHRQFKKEVIKTINRSPSISQKKLILIIDDLHLLKSKVLESVFDIGRHGTSSRVVSIVGSTDSDYIYKLFKHSYEFCTRDLSVCMTLNPLNRTETERYLYKRFFEAGLTFLNEIICRDAIDIIHQVTHGVPRAVNIFTEMLLFKAFEANQQAITSGFIYDLIGTSNLQDAVAAYE